MRECVDFCMFTKDTRCCVECSNECKYRCEMAQYGGEQPKVCNSDELYGMERVYAEEETE